MTRISGRQNPSAGSVPLAAISALSAHGIDLADLVGQQRTGRSSSLAVWHGNRVVLVVARDGRGRRSNQLEVEGRQWAAGIGVGSPTIWDAAPDGSWLLGQWRVVSPPTGSGYVNRAIAVADKIMAADPPEFNVSTQTWRAGSQGRIRRLARLAASGLSVREFLAARSEAESLLADSTAHGDFYFRNVLNLPDRVEVVDWEYAGPAPKFTDHLRFWSTIKSDEDRDEALALILDRRSPQERAHIGVLGRWLAFRLFAENVTAPRRWQNAADRQRATAGLRHGRELYAQTRP